MCFQTFDICAFDNAPGGIDEIVLINPQGLIQTCIDADGIVTRCFVTYPNASRYILPFSGASFEDVFSNGIRKQTVTFSIPATNEQRKTLYQMQQGGVQIVMKQGSNWYLVNEGKPLRLTFDMRQNERNGSGRQFIVKLEGPAQLPMRIMTEQAGKQTWANTQYAIKYDPIIIRQQVQNMGDALSLYPQPLMAPNTYDSIKQVVPDFAISDPLGWWWKLSEIGYVSEYIYDPGIIDPLARNNAGFIITPPSEFTEGTRYAVLYYPQPFLTLTYVFQSLFNKDNIDASIGHYPAEYFQIGSASGWGLI